MNELLDCVIRGGNVADGSGKPLFEADVGIADGRIVAIGHIPQKGEEEVDARGLLVTPGFIDVHTHYDAQVTWENRLRPSSDHGVTTAIIGNCGVGFAPCRPDQRMMLTKLMEGVEDIPEAVMTAGLPWNWETYPEYLDSLAARSYDIDFGSLVPHAPLRVYVMGQRGVEREPATLGDMKKMGRLVEEGLRAGAFGFSTSRSLLHRTAGGQLAPTVTAAEEELVAIAHAMADAGSGIYQLIDDFHDATDEGCTEFDLLRRLNRISGRPVHFSLVMQSAYPETWPRLVAEVDRSVEQGHDIRAQVFPRPMGGLLGFGMPHNPFSLNPSFRLLDGLNGEARLAQLRDPAFRRKLIAEEPLPGHNVNLVRIVRTVEDMFPLQDPPNYAPRAEDTVRARAAASGCPPLEIAYDLLLEQGGEAKLFFPVGNNHDPSFDDVLALLEHDQTIVALGDGGAHYGLLCDASYTTHMLSYWARDRQGSRKLAVEQAVRLMTAKPAAALGLNDRGLIAPGRRADLNIIDFDQLRLLQPVPHNDLPSGGWRVHQKAAGYRLTMVNGQATYRDGESTGALPGRLLRSGSSALRGEKIPSGVIGR